MPITPLVDKIVIIGLGLIGASIAQAIQDKALAYQVVAVDKDHQSLATAKACQLIDGGTDSVYEGIGGARI